MATHRAQTQFDRARWRPRLLLPLWGLQLMLATLTLGLSSWRLSEAVRQAPRAAAIELIWTVTKVAMAVLVVVCTVVEMAKFVAEALTPWTLLLTHVVKLASTAAMLALDMAVFVLLSNAHASLVALCLDATLVSTALSLGIYALLTYRRLSADDDYARPVNVKAYGFHDDVDRDPSYPGHSNRFGIRASCDKRPSAGSSSSSCSSSSSLRLVPGAPSPHTASSVAAAEPPVSAPGPYRHQRDTLFDEYVARRGGRARGLRFGHASCRPGEPTLGAVREEDPGALIDRAPGLLHGRP